MTDEKELQKRLNKVSWQPDNCLACVWFDVADPFNADLLDRAPCVHPQLKQYELLVSGRDWCSLFEEITQQQIEERKKSFVEKSKQAD